MGGLPSKILVICYCAFYPSFQGGCGTNALRGGGEGGEGTDAGGSVHVCVLTALWRLVMTGSGWYVSWNAVFGFHPSLSVFICGWLRYALIGLKAKVFSSGITYGPLGSWMLYILKEFKVSLCSNHAPLKILLLLIRNGVLNVSQSNLVHIKS